jgi:hypothetical protein
MIQHDQLGGTQLVDHAPIADTKPKAGTSDKPFDVVVASVRIGGQLPQFAQQQSLNIWSARAAPQDETIAQCYSWRSGGLRHNSDKTSRQDRAKMAALRYFA